MESETNLFKDDSQYSAGTSAVQEGEFKFGVINRLGIDYCYDVHATH